MHNRHLNELDGFASLNPSAENVAMVIAQALGAGSALPSGVALASVEVWETPENSAVYRA